MHKLPLEFYHQDDVVAISRQLLGKYLMTCINNELTGGIITETEAYRAPEDRASHAYGMRRTKRNETMYQSGGHCYVYLCYGLYPLFNVVTNVEGIPHAVLIRAIEPRVGLDIMLQRRGKKHVEKKLTTGPGTVTQALGINLQHNGLLLTGSTIWLEDHGIEIKKSNIIASPRVGVSYAGEDALKPWRFRIKKLSFSS